jgi:hypothetical protein
MTQSTPHKQRGRIFPEIQWSPEEKARRIAESNAFSQRCRTIFEQVRLNLIEKHYGWYVAIEPDSGDYFIDVDKNVAHLTDFLRKMRSQCLLPSFPYNKIE